MNKTNLPILAALLFASAANAAVIKFDTFTVGSDTSLESHTSDSGGGWTGADADQVTVEASTDSVMDDAAGVETPVGTETGISADHFVEVTGTLGTTASQSFGAVVRGSHGTTGGFHNSDYYQFYIDGDEGWRLSRFNAGIQTFLDFDLSYIASAGIGTSTVLKLKLQVETIDASTVRLTAWIDPDGGGYDQVAQEDDTSGDRITAAGRVGFRISNTSPRISEFNAEDFTPTTQIIEITSIAAGSPCDKFNDATDPDIVAGDELHAPLSTSPGGDPPEDFELTIAADCTFSYTGDGTKQTANVLVFDTSAGDFHAEDIDFVDNNNAPVENGTLSQGPVILDHNEAMTALDICSGFDDADGDDLTITVTDGTLPNGTSLGGDGNCDLGGTPDTEDEEGVTIEFTATDDAEDSDTVDVTFFVLGDWTVISLLDEDIDSAPTALQTARPWMTDDIGLSLVPRCNNSEAANEIFAQDPAPSAEVAYDATVTAFYAAPKLCAAIRRRNH